MIVRVFRARIHSERVKEFEQFFLETALPMIKAQRGMIAVTVGLPMAPTPNEFLMVTVWQDLEALQQFAGAEWQKPVIDPAEVDLLQETFLQHYSLVQT